MACYTWCPLCDFCGLFAATAETQLGSAHLVASRRAWHSFTQPHSSPLATSVACARNTANAQPARTDVSASQPARPPTTRLQRSDGCNHSVCDGSCTHVRLPATPRSAHSSLHRALHSPSHTHPPTHHSHQLACVVLATAVRATPSDRISPSPLLSATRTSQSHASNPHQFPARILHPHIEQLHFRPSFQLASQRRLQLPACSLTTR